MDIINLMENDAGFKQWTEQYFHDLAKAYDHELKRMHKLIAVHGLEKILEKIRSNNEKDFKYCLQHAYLMWQLHQYVTIFGVEKSFKEFCYMVESADSKVDEGILYGEIYFYNGYYFCTLNGQGTSHLVLDRNFKRLFCC